MPTYEYACTTCGHRLEAVQKFTDDPLTECPECGAALRKVYGAVGIVLKGSGFYKNDSRAASGGGSAGKKNAEPLSSESSSSDSSPKTDSSSDKGSGDKSSSGNGGSDKSGADKSSTSKDSTPASSTAS